jgi:hypothetical protein
MGRIIMKESPETDFYVEWSSVVEAPTFAGTRAEMLAHLQSESDPWLRDDAPHHPEMRLARVDETGTSSMWVAHAGMRDKYAEEGAWDDNGEIYKQQGFVPRSRLFDLTRRVMADHDADVSDLLDPFDDAAADG